VFGVSKNLKWFTNCNYIFFISKNVYLFVSVIPVAAVSTVVVALGRVDHVIAEAVENPLTELANAHGWYYRLI